MLHEAHKVQLKRVSTTLLCLIFGFAPLAAQNNCDFIFSGNIIDNHDDQALAGALVKLGDYSTLTSSDGAFSIQNICPGSYQLTVSHIQCDPLTKTIEVDGSFSATYFLEHHAEELQQIDIEQNAKRGELSKASILLTEEDLENKTGKTFGDLLEDSPGIALLKTGSTIAKPVINGLHSQRILLVNNGIRMEGQQWGTEHAPEIDPFSVQKLAIIKGAGSVEYGADGLGGAIVVEPAPLPDSYGIKYEPALLGSSNGRGYGGSLNITGKKKIGVPIGFQVQGSGKLVGNLKGADYFLDNTGVQEINYMVRAGYVGEQFGTEIRSSQFNSELGILTDSHIGNEADLLRVIENGAPLVDRGFTYDLKRPRQDILHEISQSKSYLKTKFGELHLNLSRQYNRRSEFDRFDDRPGLNLKTETYIADLSLKHELSDQFSGKIGGQILQSDLRTDGFYLLPENELQGWGLFAYERFFATDALTLEAGLRYDYKRYTYFIPISELETQRYQTLNNLEENPILYSSINETTDIGTRTNTFNDLVTGSVGATLNPNENWTFSIYSGIGTRQPLPNELYSNGVHHGTAFFEIGNSNLNPETAWTNQLNAQFQNEDWTVSSTVYVNNIDDYIYLIPDQDLDPIFTIRGPFAVYETTQSDVSMAGIDYTIDKTLSDKWAFSTNGSFLWAEDKTLNTPLIFMPSNRLHHRLSYAHSEEWSGQISLSNVFEQTRIPDASIIDDFVPPPSGYSLVGLQASYAPKQLDYRLKASIVVDNALNSDYRDYLDRFRYFAQAPGINAALRVNYVFNTP